MILLNNYYFKSMLDGDLVIWIKVLKINLIDLMLLTNKTKKDIFIYNLLFRNIETINIRKGKKRLSGIKSKKIFL